MVTRRLAFYSPTHMATFDLIRAGRYVPPEELVPDLPARFSATIRACLQVDRERRPHDCAAVRSLLLGHSVDSVPAPPVTFTQSKPDHELLLRTVSTMPSGERGHWLARALSGKWRARTLGTFLAVTTLVLVWLGFSGANTSPPAIETPAPIALPAEPNAAAVVGGASSTPDLSAAESSGTAPDTNPLSPAPPDPNAAEATAAAVERANPVEATPRRAPAKSAAKSSSGGGSSTPASNGAETQPALGRGSGGRHRPGRV